ASPVTRSAAATPRPAPTWTRWPAPASTSTTCCACWKRTAWPSSRSPGSSCWTRSAPPSARSDRFPPPAGGRERAPRSRPFVFAVSAPGPSAGPEPLDEPGTGTGGHRGSPEVFSELADVEGSPTLSTENRVEEARAGGLAVRVRGAAAEADAEAVAALAADGVPAALASGDSTLWGPDAADLAAVRLGWLGLPRGSRELLPELSRLAAANRAAGLDRVVLAGMGGSSLAPEVIAATRGAELTVLDTTDPAQVRAATADRLHRTVLVVSSKSGG